MEERKEKRWYLLWFLPVVVWMVAFCISREAGILQILRLINSCLCLAVGIINGARYKKKNGTW